MPMKSIAIHPCAIARLGKGIPGQRSASPFAMSDIAKGISNVEDLDERIRKYYEERMGTYDAFWGIGNIHVGVYDDVSSLPDGSEDAKRAFLCGAIRMTERMARESGMSEESVVVDLGCGCGNALLDLASTKHLKEGYGIDLTESLVERARASASSSGRDQMLHFYQGSVLNASSILGWRKGMCTHVMSQLSLCYVHDRMQAVLHEAAELLQPGGKLVLCDLVTSERELSLDCKERVLQRICLDGVQMLSKTGYIDEVMQSGRFRIDSHEDLSVHLAHSYDLLSRIASSPLAEDYAASARCTREGEVGMVLVVAHKMH